jgi:type I restriction enzyme, S subunit
MTSKVKAWDIVELKDIAISLDSRRIPLEASVRKSRQGNYPYYGASGIIDYIDDYIFNAETLLVAEDGANLLARVTPIAFKASGKYWVNNHAHVLKIKENANIDFIALLLNRTDLKPYITGSAQPKLNADRLQRLKITLPPLAEQKRIAAIAQKADRLRRTRRYALQLGDTYLQSVFLEMFGNPVTNPKGWDVVDLDSQIERIDSGWSPVCEESPRTSSNQWAVLRLGAVTWGIYQPNDNKLLPPDLEPRPELEVQKGDILITRKNTIELVSACALVHQTPPRLMLPDTIFRFCFKKSGELKSEYLWGLFNEKSFRKKIQSLATGTAGSMPNISKEKFLGIVLPLPPFPLQEKFAQIVQKFERLRTQQREAERQAEHLFQTLLHRAFRGELTPQHPNNEPASVLLEEIRAQQAKAEAEAKAATQAMGDAAEYLGTKAKQQDTEFIQLKLPGFE